MSHTELPGAEIALRVIAVLGKAQIERDGDFTTDYSTHEWNPETRKFDLTEPHYVTWANCSDTFFWGSADAEPITEDNIELFEQTVDDIVRYRDEARKSDRQHHNAHAETLHAWRKEWEAGDQSSPYKPLPDPHRDYSYRFEGALADLFSARCRGERPQGAAYKVRYPEALWDEFNAAGPEREVGFGNPREPGE